MVVDVRLERARRDAALVGLAIGLDLVGLAANEVGGVREIFNRAVEFTHADPAVPAVAVHARIVRVLLNPLREDLDRLAVGSHICDAPTQPDDCVRVVRGPPHSPRGRL